MRTAVVLISLVGLVWAGVDINEAPFARQFLDNAKGQGAVCLDGSDAGYYLQPASDPANANDFMIYFEGGGWCYSEGDCWGRSQGDLGSSNGWPATKGGSGLISDDCTVNPDFCKWNKVYLAYCDGNSFAGAREDPVEFKGKQLYFRGKMIIDAVMADITAKHGFANAENVLLTGCSAGGLAAYLHADYVQSKLPPSTTKYAVAPISGFFMDYPSVDGAQRVYGEQMKYIYTLSQAETGVNSRCIAAKKPEDRWQCNFAPYTLPYIESPLFVLNSVYDSWQTGCVLTAEPVPSNSTDNGHCGAAPGWADCSKNEESCSAKQIDDYNKFGDAVASHAAELKSVDGAFFTSCHTHCEAQFNTYNLFSINGVTIQQALSKWWQGVGRRQSFRDGNSNVHVDCQYRRDQLPHKCNPTCGGQ